MKGIRISFTLAAASLFGNPQGPSIVAGDVSIVEKSNELSIATSGRTIIDWDLFSIEPGETTRFLQDAPVLNRVVGQDPSRLMGMLEANGEIYLLNPQGVIIGKEAVIQTAGFIASTLNVDNNTFLSGAKLEFFGDSIASIVHEGAIRTPKVLEKDGRVFLVSKDLTKVSGSIEAPEVRVLGDTVHLTESAKIDARGGEVLIGGDYKGKNPEVINARVTQVDTGAIINVDGLEGQDGGKAIVWAEDWTWFGGQITGRGVNGGFVEVSGKQRLNYEGFSNLTPDGGKFGTLLLDPKFITIAGGGAAVSIMPLCAGNTVFCDMPAASVTLSPASVSAAINAASLVLEANTDIVIQSSVTGTTAGNGLTLRAGRYIAIEPGPIISLNGGDFIASVNDDGADIANRDAGAAVFLMIGSAFGNGTCQILTNGGDVSISHGMLANGDVGAVLLGGGSLIDTTAMVGNSGRIDITGDGDISLPTPPYLLPYALGYNLRNGVQLRGQIFMGAGSTGMTVVGNGAIDPFGSSAGIWIFKDSAGTSTNEIIAIDGLIEFTGTGGGGPGTSFNRGIYQEGGFIIGVMQTVFRSNGTGATAAEYRLTGFGGDGVDENIGIHFTGTDSDGCQTSFTIDGDFICQGTGRGTGMGNDGIRITNFGPPFTNYFLSTGEGNLSFTGLAGDGTSDNVGIRQQPDPNPAIIPGYPFGIRSDGTGSITLDGTGRGSGTTNHGVSTGMLVSTGATANAGTITVIGQGSVTGISSNFGVICNGAPAPQIITTAGDLTIMGTGGSTGGGPANHGVVVSGTITTTTAGADAANIFVTGLAGPEGFGISGFTSTTMDGDVVLNGTGGSAGNNNTGVDISTCTVTGDGTFTAIGVAGPGTFSNGVVITGAVTLADGDLAITGTGSSTSAVDPGVMVNQPVSVTGTGNILIQSLLNDLQFSAMVSTASGTMTLLAVNTSANIEWLADLSCGGDFIAAAHNDITISGISTHTFTNLMGGAVYIVDEQSGTAAGPGTFTNNGTITVASDNLAIYAASGPFFPTGLTPGPIQFSSNIPPTNTIGKWDLPAPAGANPATALNAKYSTSYTGGGPYHGPGFLSYTPGQGVFGSQVVWYKYQGFPPFVPTVSTISIPALQKVLSLIGINTVVFSPQEYLYLPFLPCPILPCIEILDDANEIQLPPGRT